MLDWDRVRVFHAVAQAGSFTRAAERLGLSQSAISRQIGALEEDLGAPLFHRHARGLVLTEQGGILLDAAGDVAKRIATAQTSMGESRDVPAGHLKVNATVGVGTVWLTAHLAEFLDRYPEIRVTMLITDSDLDLAMRQADVAIRLSRPTQPDLIQRRLITVHTHLYAAPSYLARHGTPENLDALDRHRLIAFGDVHPPVPTLNWILTAGHEDDDRPRARTAALEINNVFGMLRAAETGLGLASLPDYIAAAADSGLQRVLPQFEGPSFTAYFCYPEELRTSKRVAVFRDFLLEKVAQHPAW